MAKDHRDNPLLTQAKTDNQEGSKVIADAGDTSSHSGNELLHASLKDTGENSLLQQQEQMAPQNNDVETPPVLLTPKSSVSTSGTKDAVSAELRNFAHELNEYLTWKENLRITSVDLQIGGPYFDLWTQEANLFFRRLVIIRKRIESIKKQKRA